MKRGLKQSEIRKNKMPSGVYLKTEEHKKRISETLKRIGLRPPPQWGNKYVLGYKHSEEAKKRISLIQKGRVMSSETRKKMGFKKENHWHWKKDRDSLVKSEKKHLDSRYKEWMLSVKQRDGWKCIFNNRDCKGRLESHHILSWKDYPKLRYAKTNGITLCHTHHPRGRGNEIKLSSYFQQLVAEMK